jgi:hypothetical protein
MSCVVKFNQSKLLEVYEWGYLHTIVLMRPNVGVLESGAHSLEGCALCPTFFLSHLARPSFADPCVASGFDRCDTLLERAEVSCTVPMNKTDFLTTGMAGICLW